MVANDSRGPAEGDGPRDRRARLTASPLDRAVPDAGDPDPRDLPDVSARHRPVSAGTEDTESSSPGRGVTPGGPAPSDTEQPLFVWPDDPSAARPAPDPIWRFPGGSEGAPAGGPVVEFGAEAAEEPIVRVPGGSEGAPT